MDSTTLKSLLQYDPETGHFTWIGFQNGANKNGPAGCVNKLGYVVIRVLKKLYLAHRLAWLYMTDKWPSSIVDHKNRNRGDNSWSNLRLATKSLNGQNSAIAKHYWKSKKDNRFIVEFIVQGRKVYGGCFLKEEDAQKKVQEMQQEVHPFFYVE